jgi:hydrogenase maturation protease
MNPLLLIGYGNPLRQDDGLGWRIANAVEALGLANLLVVPAQQLSLELAAPIAAAEEVMFVDATFGEFPRRLALKPLQLKSQAPTSAPQTWSHLLTPQVLLILAGQLYGHQPSALQLLVPAHWDGHGEGLSPAAQAAMEAAIPLLLGWAHGGSHRA